MNLDLDRVAVGVANELWRMFRAGEIKSIHVDGIRTAIASAPPGTFSSREAEILEEKVCRLIINKVG
jgi:hypothetical protein